LNSTGAGLGNHGVLRGWAHSYRMSNILRRLRRLETRLPDLSGFVPHSEAWLDYWSHRIDQLLGGEAQRDTGRIPLEAIDALVAASAAEVNRGETG